MHIRNKLKPKKESLQKWTNLIKGSPLLTQTTANWEKNSGFTESKLLSSDWILTKGFKIWSLSKDEVPLFELEKKN